MRTLILWFFVSMLFLVAAEGQESMDVCALVNAAKQYDGKTVVATGFIRADHHLTGIQGEGCSRVIVIRYDRDMVPQEFADGIEDKRLRLDPRRFNVTVEGKFESKVRAPLGYISRIEITKVLHWEFVGGKTPAKPVP